MEQLLVIFFRRFLIRIIGKHSRFVFFILIKKHRSLESLSNDLADNNRNIGNALKQDFLNALVGSIVLILFSIFIAWIIWN
jgi:hypothetical protein